MDNLCKSCKENPLIFDKTRYYELLSEDFPSFLKKYISLPLLQRLSGVGLLCGTDWTPLYHNSFFYSRLDHSIGVALVLWHFTHDKKQTLAGLLHDVSTPAFSHVSDFRNGDALKQESTEEKNADMIHEDEKLRALLLEDSLFPSDVDNYHLYPLADNEIPCLSADRLEYMFPSGAALNSCFDMKSIERIYKDISICNNELGKKEFCFLTKEIAEEYCERFCKTGLILQKNENKVTMQLLAEILNLAIQCSFIKENDFFTMDEKSIIERFDFICEQKQNDKNLKFVQLYKTFRSMKEIVHSEKPLDGYFCVSIKVKKRFIDPLVIENTIQNDDATLNNHQFLTGKRITAVSELAKTTVDNFVLYSDSLYGCVKLVDN